MQKNDDKKRIIMHLDLDCFYAQVEHKRLGIARNRPLAVQQWSSLIAVNYPARDAGIHRHHRVEEAKRICKNLRFVHVATYKKGEDSFKYWDRPRPATHKVSLDPYRKESKAILDLISRYHKKVEKASVDEVFIDVTADIDQVQLDELGESDDISKVGTFIGVVHPTKSTIETEFFKAAKLAAFLRAKIKSEMEYTCSIGISSNKMLAKLCSSMHKPDQQAILIPSQIETFLRDIPISKIRSLGGKISQVLSSYNMKLIKDIRNVSTDQIERMLSFLPKKNIGHVIELLHGKCTEEVKPRVLSKSFMAAKSLRGVNGGQGAKGLEELCSWLKVVVSEIVNRCLHEGNGRWPKVMTLHLSFSDSSFFQSNQVFPGDLEDDGDGDDEFESQQSLLNTNSTFSNRFPTTGNWTKTLPAPHPSTLERSPDHLYNQLNTILVKEFNENPKFSRESSTVVRWIGLRAHTFVPVQKYGISRYLVPQRREQLQQPPSISASNHSSESTHTNPTETHFHMDKKSLQSSINSLNLENSASVSFKQDKDSASRSIKTAQSSMVKDNQNFSANQHATQVVACHKCGANIELASVQEHEDWHFARDLKQKEMNTVHEEKVSKLKNSNNIVKKRKPNNQRDPNQRTIESMFQNKRFRQPND